MRTEQGTLKAESCPGAPIPRPVPRRRSGQVDSEEGSFAFLARHLDPSSMKVHDLLHDDQAEARTRFLGLASV